MKIFKTEMNDGIGDLVSSASTLAFCSQISIHKPTEVDLKAIAKIKTTEELNTRDLFHLDAVLASVGWNENDDVFDKYETWNAKSTPEDKQFNYMHNEKDIIGHITKAYMLDLQGNRIDDIDDPSQLPDDFNVIMGSVLYRSWSDEELRKRMDSIIETIEKSEAESYAKEKEDDAWYVSMECLFPSFDYQLIDKNNRSEIVRRGESSAFLTKHLRAYGGSGKYNEYKIGRVLRDFSFSGVGLVKNPANTKSVILNKSKSMAMPSMPTKEPEMQEDVNASVLAITTQLTEANKKIDSITKQMEDAKASSDASIVSLSQKISSLEAELATAKKDKEKMDEENKKLKKEQTFTKRKAQLLAVGFNENDVQVTLNKFDALDDTTFNAVVDTLQARPVAPTPEPAPAPAPAPVPTATADETVQDVIDSTQANKDVPLADNNDDDKNLRSFASDWFSKNVFKSTAKLQENK